MTAPRLFQVSELVDWTNTCKTLHPQAGWIPLRPVGYPGLAIVRRLKIACGVFIGRYDAVHWEPKAPDAKVNIFAENAVPSSIDAVTTATSAKTFGDDRDAVLDQEQLNASAACAITAAYAGAGLETSAGVLLYMYYNERAIDEHERKQ